MEQRSQIYVSYNNDGLETKKKARSFDSKQPTFLVAAKTENEKYAFVDSSLCMIRDWEMGWFDIPYSMLDEFEQCFGTSGPEHSACSGDITKEDIRVYNLPRIPRRLDLKESATLENKIKDVKVNIEKTSRNEGGAHSNEVLR